MFHREQKTNFRVTEFSLSGAFLHSLLKPRYLNFNIGDLFEYVADALYHTVGVMTDRVDFTLINACSPFTRFSHGYAPPPPPQALPKGKALVLTFAISSTKTYLGRIIRQNVRRNSNAITKWGLDFNSNDFVSISIDMTQAEEWGLLNMRANSLQYVYNLIGAMTKNFVRRQALYQPMGRDYQDQHEVRSIRDWYSELYRMPLKQLITTVPYHLWPFNYHIWEQAPNVLPQRTITPTVATYYFMFLLNATTLNSTRVIDRRLGRHGDEGVGGYLADSILRLVQDIRTPGDRQLSRLELLAPAVIDKFIRTGSPQLETGIGWEADQFEAHKRMVVDMQMREYDLGKLFLPAKEAAYKLMRQDQNWRQLLTKALEFPEQDIG